MTIADLNFIRKEYPHCLQKYVEKYFAIVGDNPPLDEIKNVLTWNVPIEDKRVLLGKVKGKVSVFEKKYPEDIQVIIIKTHLDPDDVQELLKGYSGFDLQLKEGVVELAEKQFSKVLEYCDELSMELVLQLMADSKIAINSRRILLSKVIIRMEDDERVHALKSINALEIAKLFEPNKKPRIGLNEENRIILKIIKEAGLIEEYTEDTEKNQFKVVRKRKRSTELDVTLL